MTAVAAPPRPPLAWRDWVRGATRPGASRWLLVVAAAGWAALIALALAGGPLGHPHGGETGAGHAAHPTSAAPGLPLGTWSAQAAMWAAMLVATMLPLIAPNVRVAERRAPKRNRRAIVAAVAVGWAAAWSLAAAVLALGAWALAASTSPAGATVIAFGGAVLWQLTTTKRRAVLRCHRTCSLPIDRRRSTVAARRYGRGLGLDCALSCGPLMLAMAVTGHELFVVVPLAWIPWAERRRAHTTTGRWTSIAVLVAIGALATAVR